MIQKYRILSWDSEFFGFIVARILPDKLDLKELKSILTDLKNRKASLAYWASNSKDGDLQKVAKTLGGFLTGEKIIYVANLKKISPSSLPLAIKIEEYEDKKPNKDLINLITRGGVYSRFYVDPKISRKQYEDLHKLWIVNSVKDNNIFITKDRNQIIGFVSLNEKDKRGNIDFIVVDESFRGKGVGTALLYQAHKWFISNGYNDVQAVTQKENVIASRMYAKCGYHIEKIERIYHFWL